MDASAIIAQLATYPGLPRTALLAAGRQRREMAPLFAREIEKCLSGSAEGRPNEDALFYMFHLLGSWRETSAYRPLTRLPHLPEAELDELLGEGLTETAHRVMAAVFDGDPQPSHDIVLDP